MNAERYSFDESALVAPAATVAAPVKDVGVRRMVVGSAADPAEHEADVMAAAAMSAGLVTYEANYGGITIHHDSQPDADRTFGATFVG